MTYEFDVFISYRRHPPVLEWVRNHFEPRLTEWLRASWPHEPRIFIDKQVETGSDWPLRLQNALVRSCLLVAVWSPDYFSSRWCMAELGTMRARERLLGLRTATDPSGLVFPVKFSDGIHFPKRVTARIQLRDFTPWNVPTPSFANTADYVQFTKEMQSFAQELTDRLTGAPAWQEGWPVRRPKPIRQRRPELPRLR
jgi:hypothetical protein